MRGLFFIQFLHDSSQIRERGAPIVSIKQLCFSTHLEKPLFIHFILPCEVLSDGSCKGRKWEAPESCHLWEGGQDKTCCPQTVTDHLCSGVTAHLLPALGMAGKTTSPSYVDPTLTLTPAQGNYPKANRLSWFKISSKIPFLCNHTMKEQIKMKYSCSMG